MTIYIHQQGKGHPLVLLHGWGFDSQIWLPLLPALQARYQIYQVDLPGFGRSKMMPWEEFKAQLLAQLPAHFALLGWSLGGLCATRIALDKPQRVTRVVNVASSPCFVKSTGWPGIDPAVFYTFYEQLVHHPEKTTREFIQLQLQGTPLPDWISFSATPRALQTGLDWLLNWDLRAALKHIQLPVAYWFGRLDTVVSRSTLQAMQKQYPSFDYALFPHSAHAPFLSHPDAVVNKLMEFIV